MVRSSVGLALIAALSMTGCHRSASKSGMLPPPSRETVKHLPDWYLKPPKDNNYLFGAATAVSQDLQVAIDKAQAEGRNLVAQQLEVKYGSLTKRFVEETGKSVDSQLLDQYTSVYKGTVSQVLYGSRPRQATVRAEGPVYRAFVLMEVPTGEAAKKLMEQVKANELLYTRFRASEAFKELDAEIQKYEQWKRDQRIP
jgi:hypothetical protein